MVPIRFKNGPVQNLLGTVPGTSRTKNLNGPIIGMCRYYLTWYTQSIPEIHWADHIPVVRFYGSVS
jgi:hypothetical protein